VTARERDSNILGHIVGKGTYDVAQGADVVEGGFNYYYNK